MRPPRKDICDCGAPERWSKEPDHPIRYDAKFNEYFIAHGESGQSLIYYCPFCGGCTPESRRASFFAHVSEAEQQRIYALFRGITNERDVTERFGPPDEERDVGMMIRHPEKDGAPANGEGFRTLIYSNLSDAAEIRFNISDGGRARGTWIQKYIGDQEGQQEPEGDGERRSAP